ncbi:hypothetical protein Bca52824_021021 [Brassica carinata]|uniref:Uncharacterized protein n=1 Tax=Brassica carinata TaxID=52824 RepID=A0A8X7VUS8_BRACI|nr:hypothetical protein Bca52824_021021 [Brassica carinata]
MRIEIHTDTCHSETPPTYITGEDANHHWFRRDTPVPAVTSPNYSTKAPMNEELHREQPRDLIQSRLIHHLYRRNFLHRRANIEIRDLIRKRSHHIHQSHRSENMESQKRNRRRKRMYCTTQRQKPTVRLKRQGTTPGSKPVDHRKQMRRRKQRNTLA